MKKCYLLILYLSFHIQIFSQVQFKIDLLSDNTTYQVSLIPNEDWNAPLNTTSNAQITLTVPTGGFQVSNLISINGLWNNGVIVVAPMENIDKDYFVFSLQGASTGISYQTGVEMPIFSFENSGDCTGALEILENEIDPFWPPNAQSVNVGNQISIIGAGVGVNAYTGNAIGNGADCNDSGGGNTGCGITLEVVNLVSPSTCGFADGSIEILATGDGLPLQYSINDGGTWQNENKFENLAAGDIFQLAVRDIAVVCIEDLGDFELDAPLAAAVTNIQVTDTECEGLTGNISFNAFSEDGGDLEFSHDDKVTWQPTANFSNLSAGIYPTWVRNLLNDCESKVGDLEVKEDCSNPVGCEVLFELEEVSENIFRISMTPNTTWTFPNNITSSVQVTVKVPTGGFVPNNIQTEISNVVWSLNSTYNAPSEDSNSDYFSFGLSSFGTQNIPYQANEKTPLFTFENTGNCAGGFIYLMDNSTDLFFPPNSQSANVGQQMTVSGFGGADLPVCVDLINTIPCGDVPNCPQISEVEIQEPDPCDGINGNLNVITIGGEPDETWEYSIDGGVSFQSGASFNNLGSGIYDIVVQNPDVTCSIIYPNPIEFQTAQSPEIQSVQSESPIACSVSNGKITIQASSNETLEYSINNGLTWISESVIEGLAAANYMILVRNETSGCIVEYPQNPVILTEPNAPTILSPIDNLISCDGVSIPINIEIDREIITFTVNGTGDFSNSEVSGMNAVFDAIPTGQMSTFSVEILANDGCMATEEFIIEMVESPTAEFEIPTESCSGNEVEISFIGNASTNANLNWDLAGGTLISSSAATVDAPEATEITVSWDGEGVKEVVLLIGENGCENTQNLEIEIIEFNLNITESILQPTCDNNLGNIELVGIPNDVTIEWTAPNGENYLNQTSISNQIPGNYGVMISNVNGCSASFDYVLEDAAMPEILIEDVFDIDCFEEENGAISFSVTGSGTFQYEILGGLSSGEIMGGEMSLIENLPSGFYLLEVSNLNGECAVMTNFSIAAPLPMQIIAVSDAPTGCEIHDARICLELEGGVGPYTITSNFGNAPQDPIENMGCIEGLYNEQVTVQITDASGCSKEILVTLHDFNVPSLHVSDLEIIQNECPEDFTSSITSISGKNYMVFDENGQLFGMTPVTALPNGQYNIVEILNDCEETVEVEITGPEAWVYDFLTAEETCEGNDGRIEVQIQNLSDFQFQWSTGENTNVISGLSADLTYALTITNVDGCTKEFSDLAIEMDCETLIVSTNDTICVEIVQSLSEFVCMEISQLQGDPVQITNLCESQQTGNSLTSFVDNHCLTIEGLEIGEDQLCVEVCDDFGNCNATTVIVKVISQELIIYPGFSPNEDGINEFFTIKNIEFYPNHKLQIFTRWGNPVFNSQNYTNDWNGEFDGMILPDGTYFYLLNDGEGGEYDGYLQISR